jgi:hypothetical protein
MIDTNYINEYGFISRQNDPTNYTTVSVFELFPNPISKHISMTGWGGLGMDLSRLLLLWPVLIWMVFFWTARLVAHYPFTKCALLCGLNKNNSRQLAKFRTQLWLFSFYVISSFFGLAAQWDQPWLGFPLSKTNQLHLVIDHPHQPDGWITLYYAYEMGFFLSELVIIFKETRRSDFVEYVAHHLCTLLLMTLSFIGYEHRIGAYILIIHDLSDIFLCLTKLLHYARIPEPIVNVSFVSFVVIFFFTRLVCLPIHGYAVAFVATTFRICTVNFWILTILLHVVLQGLHVYWFVLIVQMISRVLRGVRGDVRSDSEDEEKSETKISHTSEAPSSTVHPHSD